MKKNQVLSSVKLIIAVVLLVISAFIIYSTSTSRSTALTTTSQAADSQCGNTYPDSTRCTNPPASVNCTVVCDASGQNPQAQCESCPTGGDRSQTCNTYPSADNCPAGQEKTCRQMCRSCSPVTDCEQVCGGCQPGGGNPSAAPTVPVSRPSPTPIPQTSCPDVGEWGGCKTSPGASGCDSADFNRAPPSGSMLCCRGVGTNGCGRAEVCDINTCGGGEVCNDPANAGKTVRGGTCNNLVSCPGTPVEPTNPPQPSNTPVCEEKPKGQFCDRQPGAGYCKWVTTIYNTCTGQDIRYDVTDVPCCEAPNTPTRVPPTLPPAKTPVPGQPTSTPVPQPPALCNSISVTLQKGGSINVSEITGANTLPRVPDPGETITFNSTGGPSSRFVGYWIRPIDSPDVYDSARSEYTLDSMCAFYIFSPDAESAVQNSFTMPDWKSGTLTRNDNYGKTICAGKPINFDKGVIFGVNYLQNGKGWSNNLWCRNAGPEPNMGKLHLGTNPSGKSCNAPCVIKTSLPGPTTTPAQPTTPTATPVAPTPTITQSPTPTLTYTPTPTPTRVPSCGRPCGGELGDCAPGMTCVDTINGKLCSMDQFQQACTEQGTLQACCSAPTPTTQPTYTPAPTYTPQPAIVQQQQQQQQQALLVQRPGQTIVQQVTQIVQPQIIITSPPAIIVQQQAQIQPTYTPLPPPPTYTIIPTFTPYPTQQAQASYTPVPPPPVSGNPIPFILAGVPVLLLLLGMIL